MKNLVFGGEALVFGENSLEYLKILANKRVYIVTGGNSLNNNGTLKRINDILRVNKCTIYLHSGIKANPDTRDVENALLSIKEFKPDVILAAGGGSPLDVGKILALLYDYPEINMDNILKEMLPEKRKHTMLIAIPSTSGTGSEVSKASVITYREKNIKIGIKSGALIPDVAILDPNITMSMPRKIAAETGMDALTHAIESYINKNSDDFTDCLGKGAIEGIFKYLPESCNENTIKSREKIHNFQCMAALSFANTGLGMAHGISHALGGKFNIGHGLANAIALPFVLEFNSRDKYVFDKLKTLEKAIESTDFINSVRALNKSIGIPNSLREAGIEKAEFYNDFEALADNSLLGSTLVNPVKISKDEMKELLNRIYYGN